MNSIDMLTTEAERCRELERQIVGLRSTVRSQEQTIHALHRQIEELFKRLKTASAISASSALRIEALNREMQQ